MSRATLHRFAHNDLDDLEAKLQAHRSAAKRAQWRDQSDAGTD